VKRRASSFNTQRIDHIYQDQHEGHVNFKLHYGDLADSTNIIRIIQEVQPDEIYNLGAMSHVKVSFDSPEYVANVDGIGTLRILEAVRILRLEKKTPIRLLLRSCMVVWLKIKMKKDCMMSILLFIHVRLMELLKFMVFGLPKIIERPIICLHVMEFCLITNHHEEVKHL
jgi:hypothetical protein